MTWSQGEGGVPRASQHHLDKMAELRGQLELIVIKNGDAIDEYERLSREVRPPPTICSQCPEMG